MTTESTVDHFVTCTFEMARVLPAFCQHFGSVISAFRSAFFRLSRARFAHVQGVSDLMSGMFAINAGVFVQKSLECRCRDGARMPSPAFPILKGTEFGREPGGDQNIDGLNLAQVICFPPSLETENDRDRSPLRHGHLLLLRKKFLKRSSRYGLRRRLSYFPSLESTEFDGQTGGDQCAGRLRLTEIVTGSPSFQFGDCRRQVAIAGHQRCMMVFALNAGNSQSRKFCRLAGQSAIYNEVRYSLRRMTRYQWKQDPGKNVRFV